MLGFEKERILVYGYAFNGLTIPANKARGINQGNRFQLYDPNFGISTSRILKLVQQVMEKDLNQSKFMQISLWLEHAESNWRLIDKYSKEIMRYKDLSE